MPIRVPTLVLPPQKMRPPKIAAAQEKAVQVPVEKIVVREREVPVEKVVEQLEEEEIPVPVEKVSLDACFAAATAPLDASPRSL